MIKLIYILSLSFLLAACAPEEETASTIEFKITHGDPLEIISGAHLNFEAPTIKQMDQLSQNLTASHTIFFADKSDSTFSSGSYHNTSQKHLHHNHEDAHFEPDHEITNNSIFVKRSANMIQFISNNSPNSITRAFFSLSPRGQLTLEGLSLNSTKPNFKSVELLHYSVKDDGQAFSFLIYADNGEQKVLLSMTFSSYDEVVNPNFNPDYNLGRPVQLNSGKPSLKICGTDDILNARIEATAFDWDRGLNSGLEYEVINKNYPPFSDLNSNCVYAVKNYKRLNGTHQKLTGTAFMNYSNLSNKAVDADAFLWLTEIDKFNTENEQRAAAANIKPTDNTNQIIHQQIQTAAHEIGHMLGLNHQQNGNAFSVMKSGLPVYRGVGEKDFERVNAIY